MKTNNSLQFAVITGCLRISKESIFTRHSVQGDGPVDHCIAGLNNLEVNSILSSSYGECFCFTPKEAEKMLEDKNILETIINFQELTGQIHPQTLL